MGKQLFELSKRSLKRRWREFVRACVATFLAVFFVTGVLLFQDNMYKWQMASNKERYGDWLILETNTQRPNPAIEKHPLLESYSHAESAVKLYDQDWDLYNAYAGYMSPEFIEQSYIDVEQGRMPEQYNEIAIDWNTLLKMGISPEVGQKIILRYYEGNDENYYMNKKEEQFILVGIMESYTDVWKKGKYLPGVLVCEERFKAFDCSAQSVYIHKFEDDIKTDDYRIIFDSIMEESKSTAAYNDYLYDYRPWGTESVYNYMYIVVMVIGIAAIIYQLISYKNSRKKAYAILMNMGAEKQQISTITLMETALILVISGAVGIVSAAVVGKVICLFIELEIGIVFYYVKWTVLLKGFLSIAIAVIAEQLVSKVFVLKDILLSSKGRGSADGSHVDTKKLEKSLKGHGKINGSNVTRKLSFRFTTGAGLKQNLGIRIFSLGICVVILFCAYKIYSAYNLYIENDKLPDFVGVHQGDSHMISLPAYVTFDKKDGMDLNESWKNSTFLKDILPNDYVSQVKAIKIPTSVEKHNMLYGDYEYPYIKREDDRYDRWYYFAFAGSRYSKCGNTGILDGLSEQFVNTIENVSGVSEVTYSTHETIRGWSWDGMNLENMAAHKLMNSDNGLLPYCDTYEFVTEYHSPTEDLYTRLSKYMDSSIANRDKFMNGQQIVVLVNTNPDDKYDESIKPGACIDYHYYNTIRWDTQGFPYSKEVMKFIKDLRESYKGKGDEQITETELYHKDLYAMTSYKAESLEACASPEVAGVVYLTDEIKDELKDLVVTYGYYTAIATTKLAETLCDNQNEYVEEFIGKELPDSAKCKVHYNRFAVKYDLSASFSATHNILANYGKENDVIFTSLAEEKEVYRTDLINGILRYGITILAMIIIHVLISAIIMKNRIDVRRSRLTLLKRLGAGNARLVRVCMIEAAREDLWCVVTMPVLLPVQWAICRGQVTREKEEFTEFSMKNVKIICLIAAIVVVGITVALAAKYIATLPQDVATDKEETTGTSIYKENTIEEYEENGEKYYVETTEYVKVLYRRFDKNIVSKEDIAEYSPTYLSSSDKDYYSNGSTSSGVRNLTGIPIKNIYEDETIARVELTLYNCSAYMGRGRIKLPYQEKTLDYRRTYFADLDKNCMAYIYMYYEMGGSKVERDAKEASMLEQIIIKADITYKDQTTKTEYLGFGSHQGRNCNYIYIHRLAVE